MPDQQKLQDQTLGFSPFYRIARGIECRRGSIWIPVDTYQVSGKHIWMDEISSTGLHPNLTPYRSLTIPRVRT